MKAKVIGVMAAVLMATGSASAFESWSAADDFDLVNNPAALSPWSYGGGTGSQFQLLTSKLSANGLTGWRPSPSWHWPCVLKNMTGADVILNEYGENGLIPAGALTMTSGETADEPGTVRWTAPFTGQFDVDCDFTGVYDYTGTSFHHGTNVDVLVVVDGVSVFEQNIQFHGTTSFHDRLSLAEGSVIDFTVSIAPDLPFDWSRVIVDATIAEVPEPATLSLLALGGLTVIRRRRK